MVIKSHVMSETKHTIIELMKQKETDRSKSERIKEGTKEPKKQTFKNRPLSARKPDKIINIMEKINVNSEDAKIVRVPSLNPETPPLMIIKSHLMSEPKHKKVNEKRGKDSKGPEIMKIKSNV